MTFGDSATGPTILAHIRSDVTMIAIPGLGST